MVSLIRCFVTTLLTSALLLLGLTWVATLASAADVRVEICHFPPGNPDNYHTIRISESALSAHLAHGDVGAACETDCDPPCDDGDACTFQECLPGGFCAAPEPVECNDDDMCTTDSCDPAMGCMNACVRSPCTSYTNLLIRNRRQSRFNSALNRYNPFFLSLPTTVTAAIIFNAQCDSFQADGS